MSFLAPQERELFLENLRPPTGYRLDVALATTYSLDLVALMVAPVGFTLFDVDPGSPDFAKSDPLEILEAVRRHASQIVVFHQAGRVSVPRHYRPLLTYLEDRIIPVEAPRANRAFHPKVWIVRYVNDSNDVIYRLLCLSRNLTFDRCWDTIFAVDGHLRADRSVGFGVNADLKKFVAALPGMTRKRLTKGVRAQISVVEGEIGRVDWDIQNPPFTEYCFWPLGHDDVSRWPFKERLQRVAVVSPFLSNPTLERLARGARENVLVSRRECLYKASDPALAGFRAVYHMADGVVTAEASDDEVAPELDAPLQGLHAKLYVADDGWNSHIWTGSANATSAAFDGNVEFLVQLTGKKSDLGVDVFLERLKGSASFAALLQPYERPPDLIDTAAQEALEKEIDGLRAPIEVAGWTIEVAEGSEKDSWTASASTDKALPRWPSHISVRCRLLSLPAIWDSLTPARKAGIQYSLLSFESITSYVVIEVEGKTAEAKHIARFLVNANLVGTPSNRRDRLLRHMLQDRNSVLRFLLLLLADISEDSSDAAEGNGGRWKGNTWQPAETTALFEPLMRALDRNPGRLAAIRSLLAELGATDEGRALIPEGLEQLFEAIWQASEAGK